MQQQEAELIAQYFIISLLQHGAGLRREPRQEPRGKGGGRLYVCVASLFILCIGAELIFFKKRSTSPCTQITVLIGSSRYMYA